MNFDFVLYSSEAPRLMQPRALAQVLEVSLRNNDRFGLTGFLHFHRGAVLQYLEGPTVPLFERLAVIQRDRRHRDFKVIAEGEIDQRLFPKWTMGELAPTIAILPVELRDPDWLRDPPEDELIDILSEIARLAGAGNSRIDAA